MVYPLPQNKVSDRQGETVNETKIEKKKDVIET